MRVAAVEDVNGTIDLTGHTLVVPGIGGLAHLGELCVDSVVETFELSRVAVVQSRNALPLVMASAWEAPNAAVNGLSLTTAAELYQNTKKHPGLSVLQLRSPAADGRRRFFAEEILSWARSMGVAELLVVAACSSHVKIDADLAAATELRYVCVPVGDRIPAVPSMPNGAELPILPLGHGNVVAEPEPLIMGLTEEDLEPLPSIPPPPPGSAEAAAALLHGGGIARPLVLLAGEGNASTPSIVCLMGLTGEIIDWPLTERLAKVVCLSLAQKIGAKEAPSFSTPPSWRFQADAQPQQLWG